VEHCVYGPRWNSFKDAPKQVGRKPVVCVAGLASSTLQAKYSFFEKYQVSYCSMDALSAHPQRTLDGLKLQLTEVTAHDGRKVISTKNADGVWVKPVKGTAGISSLNPGEKTPVSVWKGLID
jgi:hypothetical protein